MGKTMVEQNGGLHNTLAMESFDKGYKNLSATERELIDRQVKESGKCPTCGERPTFQDATGTYWDGYAHHWRITGAKHGKQEG